MRSDLQVVASIQGFRPKFLVNFSSFPHAAHLTQILYVSRSHSHIVTYNKGMDMRNGLDTSRNKTLV